MRNIARAGFVSMILAGVLAAQSVLQAGDVVVVSTGGLWLIRPPDTTEHQLLWANDFGGLASPAVQWRPGTDELIVSSGEKLFGVRVESVMPASVTLKNITPAAAAGSVFNDLDFHAANGRLFLLDAAHSAVLRYAPPFAAGMAPDLVLPLGAGPRSLAVDSRSWPERVIVGYADVTRAQFLAGGSFQFASLGVTGLDQDRQEYTATVASIQNQDSVLNLPGVGMLTFQLNMMVPLCAPVALGPADVEFDGKLERVLILAQDGVNPACLPGYAGNNHVVSMLQAQSANYPPIVLTGPVSTITGTNADLTLVWTDQAFVSPYGSSAGATDCKLAPIHDPWIGTAGFGLALSQAPPAAPVLLLAGLVAGDTLLKGGQAVLVATPQLFFWGVTSAEGKLEILAPIAAGLPAGFDVRVQAVAFSSPLLASNGLVVHIAGY